MEEPFAWPDDSALVSPHETLPELGMGHDSPAQEEGDEEEEGSFVPILPVSVFEGQPIDVDTYDFHAEIVGRLKSGPTVKSFSDTAALWSRYLRMLPPYDEQAIRAEIAEWDLDIPTRNEFGFDLIQEAYARQVNYRNRLTELQGVVNAHHQMFEQAQRNLREIAIKLASGPKHDKEAIAAYAVQPLVIPATLAGQMVRYLDSVLRSVDFAAIQIDRLMKERQSLSRINQSYVSEGHSSSYQRQRRDEEGEDESLSTSEPRQGVSRPGGAPARPGGLGAPHTGGGGTTGADKAPSGAQVPRPRIPTRNHRLPR